MSNQRVLTALCVLRSAVGVGTWLSPGLSGRTFGLGPSLAQPDVALMGRLFAVRDLALAQALRHPDPNVQRQVLRVGVAIDGIDALASVLAALTGGRRSGLVGVGLGALVFASLGVVALQSPTVDHRR